MKRFVLALIITFIAAFFTLPVWADSTKMYWSDYLADKIQRANLDGSSIEDLITGLMGPCRIDIDLVAGKIYWTHYWPPKIQRANLDGSSVEDLITGLDMPDGIALDVAGGKMYWTDPGSEKIQRANLDGTDVENLVTGVEAYDIALDLSGCKMYWAVCFDDIIQRANLDGSVIETVVAGEGMINGIGLDAVSGKIYWTYASLLGEGIQRANLDGSSIETLVTLGSSSPGDIALYLPDGKMYWTVYGGSIQRANLDGSNVEDIVTGLFGPAGLAIPTIPCIDNFEIEPATGFSSSGEEGGPFAPASKTYTLQNTGPNSINWTASVTQDWLDVSPSSGTLGPNDVNSVQININSNAAGLNYGSYSDTLTITNLTSGIVRSRPAELRVYGPIIELSQNEFYFEADRDGNNPANQVLGISNVGSNVLNWQISETCNWLTVDPTCGSSTSEVDDVNIIVDISGLAAGIYNCQLTVSSDYAENSPQIVIVQLRVIGPIIELSENAFYFTALEGGETPANQLLGISNAGSNVLNWQISETCDWLSMVPTSGSSTSEVDEVNIIVDISGLAAGIYTCQLTVSSNDAENSPQIVTVELSVTGPVIELSQNKFYFEAEQGGDNPSNQVLGISNIGGGVLNWQVNSPTGGWLSVDPNRGSSTSEVDEVNIIIDINGLTKGTDSCVVLVSDANAENSPQSFTVELRVVEFLMPKFKITASDGAPGDHFGTSVSTDGDRCIVGATGDDDMNDMVENSGSAYIFEWDGTDWIEYAKLTASDGESEESFGMSVDIDGYRCIVGGCESGMEPYHKGQVYLFEFNDTYWIEQQKLTISEGVETDYFGTSVGLSGNRCIVGDFGDDDYGTESGAAYIFEWNGAEWIQKAKLTASDGEEMDRFGNVVDIDGDRCIVGAWYDNGYHGSAYIFEWNGTSWTEQAKLVPSVSTNYFGYSVSISGDRCIIGSIYDNVFGSHSGSAFIFEWDGTTWIQQNRLLPSDGAAEDCFGHSVSIDGDQCIVGATGDDDKGNSSGAAYVFEWDGMTWVEQKLLASDGAAWDWFGHSVSVCNGRYLVGALYDDDNGENSGSAYVYHHYRNADLNKNWVVDFYDFTILASQWLQAPGAPSADFAPPEGDGFVDYDDLDIFCQDWLD